MIIGTDRFKGMIPRLSKHLLPIDAASSAVNVKIESGALKPFMEATVVDGETVPVDTETIFRHPVYGTFYHFGGEIVDIVASPIASDAYGRWYVTSDNPITAPIIASVSSGYAESFHLGVPPPATAPSVALVGTVGEPVLAETFAYVTTYVTAFGEEGPPSEPSAAIDTYPEQGDNSVTVGLPPALPAENNVKKVNIYRTSTTSTGETQYQLVGSENVGVANFSDSKASWELTVALPSEDWLEPPLKLEGLVMHPNGFVAGFVDDDVYLSERWLPHAWPTANTYATGAKVIGLAVFGGSILVVTNREPIIISGSDPAAMSVDKLEVGGGGTSRRGIVDMGTYVLYPSASGLVRVGTGTAPTNITEQIIDEKTWRSYNPDGFIAEEYDGKYLCSCGSGSPIDGFLLDPNTLDFMPFDTAPSAMFYDNSEGALYYSIAGGTALYRFDNHATTARNDYSWTSKTYVSKVPMNFGCGQVFAENYPVTVRFYTDGVKTHEQSVTSNNPFRMPSGFTGMEFYFEITGNKVVNSVVFSTTMKELGVI